MQSKILYNAPELLTREHNPSSFACGKPPLNQYIKKYALLNQDRDISRTYVTTKDAQVVGYYTLAFGSISHDEAPAKVKEELPQYPIPVILLARLAVDLKEKGKGLGKGLLRDAMLRTLQAADIGGLRAMLTHAKDEDAKRFYTKFGFEESPVDPLHLTLTIANIRANLF